MTGAFIVIEGPDGSGTTTMSKMLAEKLREEGYEVLLTREPTEGEHGQKIRRVLNGEGTLSSEEMQKLFCADRAEHVEAVIKPAMRDQIVLCDRYALSTLLYGTAAGVSLELLQAWNADFPIPTATVITLPPFPVCLERVGRREAQDAFENEAFMRTVYDAYAQYAKEHPEVVVIDTSGEKEESLQTLFARIQTCLPSS